MANPSVLEYTWSNECWQWRTAFRRGQADLAAYAYVSPATWSRWERGVCEPPAYVKDRVRHELARLWALHQNSVPADPEA
jgi:transcriptional regulator with XRE-family HTH domain